MSYEWAVRHINEDGVELGEEQLPSEDDARATLGDCIREGQPCVLLRRPTGRWEEVAS